MPAVVKKRLQKIILWGIVVCSLLLITLIGLAMWSGSTEPIESVAKTFKPGSDWQQTRYIVEPPRFVCLSGRCPDVSQSWITNEITENEVKRFLGGPEEALLGKLRCTYAEGADIDSCTASGVRDGYNFQVYVDRSRDGKDIFEIDLFIRKGV